MAEGDSVTDTTDQRDLIMYRRGIGVRVARVQSDHYVVEPLDRDILTHGDGDSVESALADFEACVGDLIDLLEDAVSRRGMAADKAQLDYLHGVWR